MSDIQKNYSGSCFCGNVKYEVSTPIKFIVHDHCSMCCRISGAPFVTWGGVKAEQFNLIKGKESLSTYKSSTEAERQFCKNCGSHLFFRSTRWPNEVHFTRATITEEMKENPKAHVYFSDKVPWLEINDSLPKHGGVTGMEPLTSLNSK